MKITLNNILVEGLMGEIPSLTKMDKAVLKFLHSEKKYDEYWEDPTKAKIWDLMTTFGLNDGDYIFRMWNIYNKYGDILFNDLNDIGNYDSDDYDSVSDVIIMNYFNENIVGKMVYPGWRIEMLEDIETMLAEEMITLEARHIIHPPNIFADIQLSKRPNTELVMDLLSMDEEGLGTYMYDNMESNHYDLLGQERMPLQPPKDLSDNSLKLYFDKILNILHDFIAEYDEEINAYYKEYAPGGAPRTPEGE